MMFNGLLMCGDSDTSDFTKESIGAPSLAESSASEAARAQSLENKLLATMQILKNKEETVRVQAESLALAEARIAALSSKARQTTHQLHQTSETHPLYAMRNAADGCRIDMTDVTALVDLQEMDHKIVNTLRDNLSVIEELYRECFYESAKQEELITMLRRSYLDMRLMEREKTEQIGRLQSVVHSQRCSLERCQNIALEVESLKSEISNFLNSSQNNDSGVWEREECPGEMTEDLRAIADQLRRLRDLLTTDCICGLENENMKLKKINEIMEVQTNELHQRINSLEETLKNKDNMEQQYQMKIKEKEQELQLIRRQLDAAEEGSRDHDTTCDVLNQKLKQLEALLNDKTAELLSEQRQCASQEVIIKELREEFHKAYLIMQESGKVRAEVSGLSAQVGEWRAQLAATRLRLRALEAELLRARDHCRHLAQHYREKSSVAEELQSQLEEAQSRGAALCAESRRAVCGVRRWMWTLRVKQREQDEKINQQENLIRVLQDATKPNSEHTNTTDNEPCCSKYCSPVEVRRSYRSCVSPKETRSCSKCSTSRTMNVRTSESEITISPSPPTPPRRLLRKKPLCGDVRCQWPTTRESSAQRPQRSNASATAQLSREELSLFQSTPTREMSPTDELLERVEHAHDALADAHRRWARGAQR